MTDNNGTDLIAQVDEIITQSLTTEETDELGTPTQTTNKSDQLYITITSAQHKGTPKETLLEATDKALSFYEQDRSQDAIRNIGNIGKYTEEKRVHAIELLGAILSKNTISEDERRTATVELGSIATKINKSLASYETNIDEREETQNLIDILGHIPSSCKNYG